MHVFTWDLKRAHWTTTWFMIHEFEKLAEERKLPILNGMTPARYDILFLLWQRPDWHERLEDELYAMPLKLLNEKLGLHPSTVSKCVSRMVELGLLAKAQDPAGDRRKVFVVMTERGFRAFETATLIMFETHYPFLRACWRFAETVRLTQTKSTGARVASGKVRNDATIALRLHAVGRLLRRCAVGLGSKALPVYDPKFVDPELIHAFARFQPARPRGGWSEPPPEIEFGRAQACARDLYRLRELRILREEAAKSHAGAKPPVSALPQAVGSGPAPDGTSAGGADV